MVVSQAISYRASAHLFAEGAEIQSKRSLKVLGFIIDSDCGIWSQVNALRAKFRRRVWTLRVAKKAGMSEGDLIATYKTHIRPVVESNAVIIQPMITSEQSEALERQQSLALSIIFGPGISAEKMRKRARIERLETRRIARCRGFVERNVDSERFSGWFPRREQYERGNRRVAATRIFEEARARTDRRFNSPLFYYRRLANEMYRPQMNMRHRLF